MKEFVYGTEYNYDLLENLLEDGDCHIYPETYLPEGCFHQKVRIGFENESTGTYLLSIDRGIHCTNPKASKLFKTWLANGELRFLEFDDIKEFFSNLKMLY